MKRVMLAVAVSIAVLGSAAFASDRAINLTDLAVITDGEGAART